MRAGRFTSSEMHKLTSNGRAAGSIGAPFHTYVDEKRMERRLGRSLDTNAYSRSMAWGLLIEEFVFLKKLDFTYKLVSSETLIHPEYDFWAGTPDVINSDFEGEIKCYEPKNFCGYAASIETGDVAVIRKNHKKEYWQLVSNACILGVDFAEIILFMPYQKDLEEIREFASNYDGVDQWKYRFIYESEDSDLPHVPNESTFKDLYKFKFEVPMEDKAFLRHRVIKAEEELKKYESKLINNG